MKELLGPVRSVCTVTAQWDLTNEVWNSDMNAQRDSLGAFAKFVNPTVANNSTVVFVGLRGQVRFQSCSRGSRRAGAGDK